MLNINSHLDGVNYGGIADRTDYDLSRHMEHSKKSLEYLDPQTNEKYIPYVIEPSVGADRLFYLFSVIVIKKKNIRKWRYKNSDEITSCHCTI